MPGDYSRITFAPANHYSGVLMQQGRVQLDADWNEQLDIEQHRTRTETIDVVGRTGVPKNTTGFQLTVGAGNQLMIGAGRFYLEGLLCELEQPTPYAQQAYSPGPIVNGIYVAYLDAWQREINFRDNPRIHEVALGEADTALRRQTVWQVRLLPVVAPAQGQPTCQTAFPEWTAPASPLASSTGRLNVQTAPNAFPRDPCSLPPTTGYRRLENQLYRVEIQQPGNEGVARFKWSRDNATVETTIDAINNATLTVADLGRDEVLGFAPGQWVEIVDERSSLNHTPNPLLQIQAVNVNTREVTLTASAAAYAGLPGLKLRRWDQNAADIALGAGGWLDLEDGLQVQFEAGTYRAGDYWTFPARTVTGDVEWPRRADLAGVLQPQPQLPAGTVHAYARLAVLQVVGGVVSILDDCRPSFPPLTAITARDVFFDNTNCQFGQARTVQEALDLLCARRNQGSCTVTALPGDGWEAVFDQIGEGQDAQICFPVGTFMLREPKRIQRKGHLKINGSGPGTRIIATNSEAALVFEQCNSVLIRDLYVETNWETEQKPETRPFLRGALTFVDCPSVDVAQVDLRVGPAPVRTATGLTVYNRQGTGAVRVSQCDLRIGHQQQGILLVNVTTATVADNTLRTDRGLDPKMVFRWLENKDFRAGFRQHFFRRPATDPADRGNHLAMPYRRQEFVFFKTHSSLRDAWIELLNNYPFSNRITSKQMALEHLKRVANRLLRDEAFRQQAPRAFRELYDQLIGKLMQTAAQGITIGGQIARDVRILNNSIEGAVQGIQVGQSHATSRRDDIDRANTVLITGNTLDLQLPATALQQDRHGIFVGNVDNAVIENNTLYLTRHADVMRLPNDGIRVWGYLGRRVLISQNTLPLYNGDNEFGFSCGIRLHPITKEFAQWLVWRNVASNIEVSNGAVAEGNFPQ